MKKALKDTFAIDLSPDAVRLVDVSFRRGVPFVSTVLTAKVEPGANDTLPDRHLAALGNLVSAHRLKRKPCVASIPTNLVVTRSMASVGFSPRAWKGARKIPVRR